MQYGERFNTITHLIGAVFSLIAGCLLLSVAIAKNDLYEIIAFSIYFATTVGLYSASTLYHGSQGTIKARLRRIDYIGIYLKIAGNYTPFLILVLRGRTGWLTVAAIWTMALLGIAQEIQMGHKTRRYSMIIYCLMTVVILPFIKHFVDVLPFEAMALIGLCFVFYFAGFYFYLNDDRIKHGHGLWHIGVVGGSICQFFCLIYYIA
jgi:hemolysin III